MKIVCFGDSLTSCGGENGRFSDILQDRFPNHEFINKGKGGEGFQKGLLRLETDVLCLHPDVVLIEFAANDWWRNERHPDRWAHDLETMVTRIEETGSKIIILGVFGDYLDVNDNRVPKKYGIDARGIIHGAHERSIANKHKCQYVPNIQEKIIEERQCWLDMNHPNELGNRHVADAIEPFLYELLHEHALPVRKPNLKTLADIWNEAVMLAPDKTSVIFDSQHLSYAEANRIIRSTASSLVKASGKANPKVAVFMQNCIEYYFIYWAVACLGGVIVPLNTWLKKNALSEILTNVEPDVIVVESLNNTEITQVSEDVPIICSSALASVSAADTLEPAKNDHDDMAIIMHTSGTTSIPKGAVMRHSDLIFNITTTINAHQFCESDIHLVINPMFHCTALYSSLPTAAYTKASVVISSPTRPESIMNIIQKERITTILSVPSVFQQMLKLKNIDSYDTSSLRLMAYAGSNMPIKAIRGLSNVFPNVHFHNFFGMTETISMTHVLNSNEAEDRPDSIGRLLPFVDAIIIDKNKKKLLSNEQGELLFARRNVIQGYYNHPELLDKCISNINGKEWFHTGDIASKDADGYFFITGRQKDMIIVGGENVYSAEIETFLMAHEQVREVAVKGVQATGPASFLGARVKAFVVAANDKLTETELRRYCFSRLPSYKVPYKVEFIQKLPRNQAGKVLKDRLT